MDEWIFPADKRGTIPADQFVARLRAGLPVRVAHAAIQGPVDLAHVDYPHELSLLHCEFTGFVDLSEAHFAKSVNLSGSVFRENLKCEGTRFGGYVRFTHGAIQRGKRPAEEVVNFDQMHIGQSFIAYGLISEIKLHFANATIAGRLVLTTSPNQRTTLQAGLTGTNLSVGGTVDLRGAQVTGDVSFMSADFQSDLECCPVYKQRTHIVGELNLRAATVAGEVNCSGALIEKGVNAQDVTVLENLYFSGAEGYRAHIKQHLFLRSAKVAGTVHLRGTLVEGNLSLMSATITGDIACRPDGNNRAFITGELNLRAANVTGEVDCSGVLVGKDVVAQDLIVKENLYFSVAGTVRAQILGTLNLSAARVSGAIQLRGLTVLRNLDLRYAHTGGDLAIIEAKGVRNKVGGTLFLTGVQCGKTVSLYGTYVRGSVLMHMARCESIQLGYDAASRGVKHGLEIKGGVDIQGTHVFSLGFHGAAGARGLVLRGTEASIVQIDGALPARVDLEKFRFKELVAIPGKDYLGLLNATFPYAESTYLQMEQWLRDRGDNQNADKVYLAMRRRTRREPGPGPAPTGLARIFGPLWRCVEWLALDVTVGYGTRSYRLFFVFIALVALSTWIFLPRSAVEPANGKSADATAYTAVDAFWVALELNLPVVEIPAAEKWKPSDRVLDPCPGLGLRYHDYASIVAFLSWIIVPLFLASMAGIIKKQG